jgi:hypothetical protein
MTRSCRRAALGLAAGWLVLLGAGAGSGSGMARMVVADLPYDRVLSAAVRALDGYPIERHAAGVIVTGWRARPARADEPGFEGIEERVTLTVERFGERITRVTAEVEARGRRGAVVAPIPDTRGMAREILAKIREAQAS